MPRGLSVPVAEAGVSYAVDKHLRPADLGLERVDVIVGAVLTGMIGLFIVVACATWSPRSSAWGSRERRLGSIAIAAGLALVPGAPLVPILFPSQALNAVLLLVLLPFMRRLARDPAVMGEHAVGRASRAITGVALGLVALSVAVLAVLTVT
jgi:hypothetical protein